MAASSCASVSAQIIQHPTFGNQPVKQIPGQRGRHPKTIASLHTARYQKWLQNREQREASKLVEDCRRSLELYTGALMAKQADLSRATAALSIAKQKDGI